MLCCLSFFARRLAAGLVEVVVCFVCCARSSLWTFVPQPYIYTRTQQAAADTRDADDEKRLMKFGFRHIYCGAVPDHLCSYEYPINL